MLCDKLDNIKKRNQEIDVKSFFKDFDRTTM